MSVKIKSFKFTIKTLIGEAFKIRDAVFIKEQNTPIKIEFDGLDKEAIHFIIFSNDIPVGTSRYRKTEKGIKLERFAILKEYRKKGFASKILNFMLEEVEDIKEPKYLYAQITAVKFYEKHNFKIVSNQFMEAGIVHFEMDYLL